MKQKRVWIYTRLRGDTDQRAAQKARLLQDAMEHGYAVVGCSKRTGQPFASRQRTDIRKNKIPCHRLIFSIRRR